MGKAKRQGRIKGAILGNGLGEERVAIYLEPFSAKELNSSQALQQVGAPPVSMTRITVCDE